MDDIEDKHHLDPHFGHGDDEVKAEDTVFADEKRWPIGEPIDVHDAIHAWGSYRGEHTFDEFRARLTSIAIRKGRPYVMALPARWRKELEAAQTGKAMVDDEPSIKVAGDWELDILALPFGGPQDGKDLEGEFFDETTETHEDQFPTPPLVYYHGLDDKGKPAGAPEYIGKTIRRWVDERGIWFRGVLDKASALAQRVWAAAQGGKARASSGTAGHLCRKDSDGHIREWPVVEVSLFDMGNGKQPANPYAIAIPATKTVYERAGIAWSPDIEAPEAAPEVEQSAADAAGVPTIETQVTQGATDMELTEFKTMLDAGLAPLQAKLDQATADLAAIKAEVPKPDPTAGVAVNRDEADTPFKTLAEQCQAIKRAALGGRYDSRLSRLKAAYEADMEEIKATGANEAVPSQGGFLLDPTLVPDLLMPLHQEGPFSKMVRPMPVSAKSNYGWINGIDETSRATGSRWGGIRGYRLGEAALKTGSKPKFRRINWELKKYAVLAYATDEMLEDASQWEAIVKTGASEELSFMANDDILNGAGANGPLGILSAGCLVTQAAEAGQLADTVVQENLEKMWACLLPRSRASAKTAWFINCEVEPFLNMLLIAGGAGVLEARFVQYGPEGILRIKGKPVIVTEFNSAIGDLGDIVLGDMSEYLFWEKGGVQTAQSIHVLFLYDESVFRFVYRCDGQPALASALTPYKGSTTQSPFVTLAAR